jgi:hypothetical protein
MIGQVFWFSGDVPGIKSILFLTTQGTVIVKVKSIGHFV